MDKPTPPKAMTETESAPGWPAGTKGCLLVTDAQIEAFGEAMAAWGAAQEREKHKRVDWRGLALDLEQQAAFSRSQTAERAMLAAARGLRLMGASE